MTDADDENNLMVTGALYALLSGAISGQLALPVLNPTAVVVVSDERGYLTNQMDITLSFMKSPYRITVERVP